MGAVMHDESENDQKAGDGVSDRESDAQFEDFASAMQDVQPLNQRRQTVTSQSRVASDGLEARRRAAEEFQTEEDESNFLTLGEVESLDPLEVLEWRQDGIQLAVFDKLRKGGYEIARELDLHQRTVKEARSDLYQLLNKAHDNNWRCVLISHGKGVRSATPARLKSYVAHWLTQHPLVLAFCSAQRHRGGTGAVYALIKKSAASREENRERFGQKSDTP
jgi:DNA-nicking Smr family endonuclease